MKKFAIALLSIMLVLSCTVMAFAEPSQYIITVDPAFDGETYTAYKIFDVVYTTTPDASDPTADPTYSSYTYSISSGSQWWSTVTTPAVSGQNVTGNPATDDVFSVDGLTFTKTDRKDTNQNDIYLVTLTNGESLSAAQKREVAKVLSEKLAANTTGKTAADTQTASGDTVDLDVGEDGYYFVTTSLGALCVLDTTHKTVKVGDKNAAPTVQKKVDASSTHIAGTFDDETSVCIGQPVDFQIIVTDSDSTDKALTLTDTMPTGSVLVYESGKQGHFRISIVKSAANGGGTTTLTMDYDSATGVYTYDADNDNVDDITITPNANGRDFVIDFSAAFMKDQMQADDQIVILYRAALTSEAEISGNTNGGTAGSPAEAYNDNLVVMTYSQQEDRDTARLYTYEFDMVKVDDDDNKLTGAEFDLYDAANGGNQIYVTKDLALSTADMNVYYINPDAASSDKIEAGLVRFVGLGEGTYYLEETKAPDNYNELDSRAEMQVGSQNSHVVLSQENTKWVSGYKVVNHNGSILPSTGGIGTYIFTGLGAILVVGAVVVLVSKKRMHAYSE